MNRDEAKKIYVSAINEIEIEPNDFFVLDLPAIEEDEAGNLIYEIYFSPTMKAVFSNSCKNKFEEISKWLLKSEKVYNKYSLDDVILIVMKEAIKYVENSDDIIIESFMKLRDSLQEQMPPLLTIVPMKGVTTEKIFKIENVVIGMLSEEIEALINSTSNEYGSSHFEFTDDVVWTEDYLHWKNSCEEEKDEIDISDLPILFAIWTHQHGYKSTERIHEYIDLFTSTISYLKFKEITSVYIAPDVLTINDYCEIYQNKNHEYGYDSKQFLVHSPLKKINKSEFFQMRESFLNMDDLTQDDLDFIGRMFCTLEGNARSWEIRFARFLHWFHIGNKGMNISNSMVSYSIALESLLNPERVPESVTNTIAERVSYLDEFASADERIKSFKNIKKLYDKRSRVTHGQEIMSYDMDEIIIKEMIQLLFDISQKFLICAKKHDWKEDADMDRFFELKKFS